MHLVQTLQVTELNHFLLTPSPLLYSLQTQFGLCPEINMIMINRQFIELFKIRIKSEIKFEFHVIHLILFIKQLGKNLLVSNYTPL